MQHSDDRYRHLADVLAGVFLNAPWTAEQLAESGASRLDGWPSWLPALTERVTAVFRVPPLDRPGELRELILGFLAWRVDREQLDLLDPARWGVPAPPAPGRDGLLGPAATAGFGLGRSGPGGSGHRGSGPVGSGRVGSGPGGAGRGGAGRVGAGRVGAGRRGAGVRRHPSVLTGLQLPQISSAPDLADLLELSVGQLEWLADVRGLERTTQRERLRNYRYLAIPRRGALPRVIEAPKLRLKEVQRWILRELLRQVPSHPAAHGFVPGRSAITHAELHTGQRAVLRLDLKDFFASVPAGRVYRTWRTVGYPPRVAHVLTGLTTNVVPVSVWRHVVEITPTDDLQARFWLGRQLATPHLPQGAPTSPALANLAAFRLDRRLLALAEANGLRYSRYADDLAFSGSSRLIRRRGDLGQLVSLITGEEGFRLNESKSAVQASGGRQTVCGVVVNVRTNLRRTEYEQLRAILHNAARHGPGSQNREGVEDFRAHLLGRISWAEALNPGRGRRLRELFAAIDWS